MAFKFITFVCLVAAANAGFLPAAQTYSSLAYNAAPAYVQQPQLIQSYAAPQAAIVKNIAQPQLYQSYAAQPALIKSSAYVQQPQLIQSYAAQPALVKSVAAPAYVQSYAAPQAAIVKTVAAAPALVKTVAYEAPANYDFSYSVQDGSTGDFKQQSESRKGDNVQGQYSLVDADGKLRTVDYSADEVNGFNAVVRREPLGVKVAAAPAKIITAAPTQYIQPAAAVYQSAPLIKSAPLIQQSYIQSAPLAYGGKQIVY